MARASYSLQKYRKIPLESANGTTYTANIWHKTLSGTSEYILAADGIKLDWESADVQDKNSPILASKLTLDVMVANSTRKMK